MKVTASNISIIKRLLGSRGSRPLRSILNKLEPADIASLMGQLTPNERKTFLETLVSIEKASETLLELPSNQLVDALAQLGESGMVQLFLQTNEEDVAYFISHLDEDDRPMFVAKLPKQRRLKVEQILSYPEGSAGRMMQPQVLSLDSSLTAEQGLLQLRTKSQEQSIYYIYCVDELERLEGVISLRELATAPPNTQLKELLKTQIISIAPQASAEEAARIVAKYNFIAIPVLEDSGKLLGIITVDDVVDIIQEQATANIYAQAGLQEDDRVYSATSFKIRNRLPWMMLNLVLAALASTVISLFEATISQMTVLATIMNIVAGMGGNTAIQTMTVVTRGLATGDFNFIKYSRSIFKEVVVGVSLGLMTGVTAGVLIWIWKGSPLVGVVMCLSMVTNSLVAATVGAVVPITIHKLNWDPATGSGVIVTMMSDICSFLSFLGIATLFMSLFGMA